MNTKKITNLDSNDRKRDMDRFAIACNLYGEEDRGNGKKRTAPAAMRDAGKCNFYFEKIRGEKKSETRSDL